MTLSILSVAYPFAPVSDDAVGGAEQVLARLDAALVEAGHRSLVLACEGSRVRGDFLAAPAPPAAVDEAAHARAHAFYRDTLGAVLERESIDLVHLHGIDFADYLPRAPRVPVLVTLHLPPHWYPPRAFEGLPPGVRLHCVSRAQQHACPPGAPLLPPITNGVDLDALAARCRKRRYALWLGRVCPEKNPHAALEAGRRAGMPVLLAGAVFPYEAHQRYFREQLGPRLDPHRRFIGPVGLARKRRLLAGARCLLLPSLAPETSSLVAMEALACGTPVVAYARGALPEIVEHGVTGYLVANESEMAEAIAACDAIPPERCRTAARERFAAARMVQEYFQVYEQLVHPAPLAAAA